MNNLSVMSRGRKLRIKGRSMLSGRIPGHLDQGCSERVIGATLGGGGVLRVAKNATLQAGWGNQQDSGISGVPQFVRHISIRG